MDVVSGPAVSWPLLLAGVLVTRLVLGRALLSFLPPGRPGGHQPSELPATLGATLLCATFAWQAWTFWLPLLPGRGPAWPALIAAALVLIRWATLPAGFVPGTAASPGPSRGLHRGLRWAAALSVLARALTPLLTRGVELEAYEVFDASWDGLVLVSSLFLIDHALVQADAQEVERDLIGVALAALVWWPDPELLANGRLGGAILALSAAASGLVGWWRRADRRAGVLCALSLALLIAATPRLGWTGAAGMAVLIAGTSVGGRGLVAKAGLGALAFLWLPIGLWTLRTPGASWSPWGPFGDRLGTTTWHELLLVAGTPLALLALGLLLAWSRRPLPRTA